MAIGDYLDVYTFEYLMDRALSNVPDTIDKRQGSIIYDALAPACYELSEFYMELKKVLQNSNIETATGIYLDYKVAEQGLTREPATYAIKKAEFRTDSDQPASIPIGTRFSTISDDIGINYYVLEPYTSDGGIVPGVYKLKCETLGTVGNNYIGNLLPLDNIQNLKSAVMSDLLTPAQDAETDEALRARYFEKVNQRAFGGNIAQYDEMLKNISGIGEVQVYPVWNGGGTVKCSIVDTQYNAVSQDFIETVQELIDPIPLQGIGLGMAPIGHTVTIVTPTNYIVDIETMVSLQNGFSLAQLQPLIEEAIEKYLLELRSQWGTPSNVNEYSLAIYIARINSAILSVPGVVNVAGTTMNGGTSDITLQEDAMVQQLPKLGTVTIHE